MNGDSDDIENIDIPKPIKVKDFSEIPLWQDNLNSWGKKNDNEPPTFTPPKKKEVERKSSSGTPLSAVQEDEWMDASEFTEAENANDWDMLINRGTPATSNRWDRNSLFQKFDPLCNSRVSIAPRNSTRPINALFTNNANENSNLESFTNAESNQNAHVKFLPSVISGSRTSEEFFNNGNSEISSISVYEDAETGSQKDGYLSSPSVLPESDEEICVENSEPKKNQNVADVLPCGTLEIEEINSTPAGNTIELLKDGLSEVVVDDHHNAELLPSVISETCEEISVCVNQLNASFTKPEDSEPDNQIQNAELLSSGVSEESKEIPAKLLNVSFTKVSETENQNQNVELLSSGVSEESKEIPAKLLNVSFTKVSDSETENQNQTADDVLPCDNLQIDHVKVIPLNTTESAKDVVAEVLDDHQNAELLPAVISETCEENSVGVDDLLNALFTKLEISEPDNQIQNAELLSSEVSGESKEMPANLLNVSFTKVSETDNQIQNVELLSSEVSGEIKEIPANLLNVSFTKVADSETKDQNQNVDVLPCGTLQIEEEITLTPLNTELANDGFAEVVHHHQNAELLLSVTSGTCEQNPVNANLLNISFTKVVDSESENQNAADLLLCDTLKIEKNNVTPLLNTAELVNDGFAEVVHHHQNAELLQSLITETCEEIPDGTNQLNVSLTNVTDSESENQKNQNADVLNKEECKATTTELVKDVVDDRLNVKLLEYPRKIDALKEEIALLEAKLSQSTEDAKFADAQRLDALDELNEMESAFADVLLSYEGGKALIKNFEQNQKILKNREKELQVALSRREEKLQCIEKRVSETTEWLKKDSEARLKELETENTRLKAKLRMGEMKIMKLESGIEQAAAESVKLRNLCDELLTS